MRYLSTFLLSLLMGLSSLPAQTILDLFVEGPFEFDRHLSPESLKLIADKAIGSEFVKLTFPSADQGESDRKEEWRLTADLANGYLKLEQSIFYEMEMVYWRKSDGTRLVGQAYLWKDAPYFETELFFYQYDAGTWTKLSTDSIMPYLKAETMLDTASVIAINKEAGLDIPFPGPHDLSYATVVHLPRRGKSIKVEYEWVDSSKPYRGYQLRLYKPDEKDWVEMPWKDGWFGRLD